MYPVQHEINDTTESNTSAPSLDGQLHTCTYIYDKRDDVYVHISKFLFPSNNIQSSPAFGVLFTSYHMPGSLLSVLF